MSLRCLIGIHSRQFKASCLSQCDRCGAWFWMDYFQSCERGYPVRYKIKAREAQAMLNEVQS